MDYRKVFWGVIFILIGLLFVLKNMGVLVFSWYQFINLWPLLLVLWGISMLPAKGIYKLILSFAVVIMGVLLVNKFDRGSWHWDTFPRSERFRDNRSERDTPRERQRDRDQGWEKDDDWSTQSLFFPYSTDITRATLKLDAAAGSFTLNSSSDQLIEVEKEGNFGSYSLTSQEARDTQIVRLSMEETTIRGNRLRHKVDIKLHEEPLWDFDLSIGAAKLEMDLSPFKTRNINIDGGASALRLKVGDLHPETEIEIDAGASSIIIEVPKNSGCRVRTNTILSGKNMDDFFTKGDGTYETDNFGSSQNQVKIKIDVAVSKIEVRRY
jgi:hypothetical protein